VDVPVLTLGKLECNIMEICILIMIFCCLVMEIWSLIYMIVMTYWYKWNTHL